MKPREALPPRQAFTERPHVIMDSSQLRKPSLLNVDADSVFGDSVSPAVDTSRRAPPSTNPGGTSGNRPPSDSAARSAPGTAAGKSVGIASGTAAATARFLVLLPGERQGNFADTGVAAAVEAGLRLGAEQSADYRPLTEEERTARYPHLRLEGEPCFGERCLVLAAHNAPGAWLLAAQISKAGADSFELKLALADPDSGDLAWALDSRWRAERDSLQHAPNPAGVIAWARDAARLLLQAERGELALSDSPGMDSIFAVAASQENPMASNGLTFRIARGTSRFARGHAPAPKPSGVPIAQGTSPQATSAEGMPRGAHWKDIPWLNIRDSVDNRLAWQWAGSGLLAVGAAMAYAQGQLLLSDINSSSPQGVVQSGGGPSSLIRGFFAAPTLGARYAAMGGAGMAQVDNGLSLLMNPAGLADAVRQEVVAARAALPDGAPTAFLGFSGPVFGPVHQGLGILYQGDGLENETTLHAALACDLGALWKPLEGVKAGATVKVYLAEVGASGTGLDRATGHSVGIGLDVGLRARLNERISAALAVRDAAGAMVHTNTFTDRSYPEWMVPEYRVGAAYHATEGLLLLMDGQKGLFVDQGDHVRIGAEQTVMGFLTARAGLHEVLGREEVRKISLGFGLDTEGMHEKEFKVRVAVNYAYEFGLNGDAPLGAGQQFSLEMGF